jgi:hypothetical protein
VAPVISPVFQVWNHNGSAGLSVLEATADWAISDVFCDVGSLSLTVPLGKEGVSDLLADADRQVRVIIDGAPDMWFVTDDDAWEGVSDAPESEPRRCALRGLAAVFDEWFYNAYTEFTAATPGAIVKTIFDAGKLAGFFQGITLSGSATVDAAGASWPQTLSVTYYTDKTLLAVLKQLSDARIIEWRMAGRVLEIYKPAGGLVLTSPVVRSRKSIATHVQVTDDVGAPTIRTQSLTGRRNRMALVAQPDDATTAPATVGDLYLAAHATADVQLSHDLTDSGDWLPWVTYRPGDRIPTVAAGGGVTSWRVQQIAVQGSSSGQRVSVELGSLLKSAEERFEDRLSALSPGVKTLG